MYSFCTNIMHILCQVGCTLPLLIIDNLNSKCEIEWNMLFVKTLWVNNLFAFSPETVWEFGGWMLNPKRSIDFNGINASKLTYQIFGVNAVSGPFILGSESCSATSILWPIVFETPSGHWTITIASLDHMALPQSQQLSLKAAAAPTMLHVNFWRRVEDNQ